MNFCSKHGEGHLTSESGLKTFLGPSLLLIVTYLIYLVRYPMWWLFTSVEPLFMMLILSYLIVLIFALLLLRIDSKTTLSNAFRIRSYPMALIGVMLAFLFQGLWFLVSFAIGSKIEFVAFPSLKGYENYAVYSVLLGFILYLVFSVFGAFAEEVAYRRYVQSRISSRYGYVVGISVTTLFFSLQHIHIFELNWVERFLQTQFIYVLFFGIFVGYLFFKSKENIWSIFGFHAITNIFNVSLPISMITTFQFANQLATVTSFILMILLLHYFLSKN